MHAHTQWINVGALVMMTGLGLLTGSAAFAPVGGGVGGCWSNMACRTARVRARCVIAASHFVSCVTRITLLPAAAKKFTASAGTCHR